MNNSSIFTNAIRFATLVLLQVLVFQRISNGINVPSFNYINIFIYPIFIMLLPVNMPHALTIIVSFLFGFTIDWFYNSLGIHAGACVFTAFVRPLILGFFEPRGGYPQSGGPTQYALGLGWFLRYSAIMLALHLFFYFSIQYFSFYYTLDILISTVMSFIASIIFVTMYQFLLNPKE